jgi:hypothetical protein
MKVGSTPTNITLEIEIAQPIDVVWADFAEIGNIYLSAPTVGHSHLMLGKKHGIGAKRHMDMSLMPGAVVHEQVIGWEEGVFMELEMVKIKGMPGLQSMGGDFLFTAKGRHTVLRSTLNYSMSNGFFGVMNRLMMNKVFLHLWTSILSGYKHHIETGEQVTSKTKLNTKAIRQIAIQIN